MSLESVLTKSKYTEKEIEEDFQLINELARNYHSIENFISDIILDSSRDKWSSKEKKVRVVLTTIHSAKGLEFEEVHFLYDPSIEYPIEKLEENRRQFYTAVSRAKDSLYIYDYWNRNSIHDIIYDFQLEQSRVDFSSQSRSGIKREATMIDEISSAESGNLKPKFQTILTKLKSLFKK